MVLGGPGEENLGSILVGMTPQRPVLSPCSPPYVCPTYHISLSTWYSLPVGAWEMSHLKQRQGMHRQGC